jgi:hypothetical protein
MRKSNKIRLKKRLETVFKCVSIRLKMMVALRILKSFSRYTFIYSGALHFLQCTYKIKLLFSMTELAEYLYLLWKLIFLNTQKKRYIQFFLPYSPISH